MDGFECVKCDSECKQCPSNSYRSDKNQDGSYYDNFISKCIKCDKNSTSIDSNCLLNTSLNLNNYPSLSSTDSLITLCQKGDSQACQYLANKCVLTLYDSKNSPCSDYLSLLNQNVLNLSSIYFNDDLNIDDYYKEYLAFDQELIKLKYDRKNKCKTNDLNFFLSEYKLNGILNTQ